METFSSFQSEVMIKILYDFRSDLIMSAEKCVNKGLAIFFLRGGIVMRKKLSAREKIDEVYCLSHRYICKNCLQRLPLLCEIWGIKKNYLRGQWRKKNASAQSMMEKNFLPPRNCDTSTERK